MRSFKRTLLTGLFIVNTDVSGVVTIAATADESIEPDQAVVRMDFIFTGSLPELEDFSIADGSCLLTNALGGILAGVECELTSLSQLR